ncbi:hypothetical protein BDQ12DRAFT_699295 [Crucibulum laeve]|uniref:NADH:flavin oxidoreductase/NADH oxidase N-terminal domain-containing protein n=1 Tax=Crucibulum laeve TaxID=68775 RepID=A0A5C3LYZ5_9AGAR|nr:hypothetical protein BDQ12DRAFT_699295 [Crucibulum laeve]
MAPSNFNVPAKGILYFAPAQIPPAAGGILTRGPGLTIIEVTASQKIAIQLAHAARKASTVVPWIESQLIASKEVGGWPEDVWAPSAITYEDSYPHPKVLNTEAMRKLVKQFGERVKRVLKAGFDVSKIHNANGHLLHEFLSPINNKRTDAYTRIRLEIVNEIRSIIPKYMLLFLRFVLSSEANEPSWFSEDTVHLVNHPSQMMIRNGPAYQSPFAKDVMRGIGAQNQGPLCRAPWVLLVGTVGPITAGPLAKKFLQEGVVDVILVGHQFQKNPGTVWVWAEQLGGDDDNVQIQLAYA